MMIKKWLYLIVLSIGIFTFTGCEALKEAFDESELGDSSNKDDKPIYVISINRIVRYPRAKRLEKEIKTFSGRSIWINVNPFLHSRNIEEIKLEPIADRPGFYNMSLKLDRQGRIIWIALTEQAKINQYGVLIDGVFYRTFEPRRMSTEEDEWVLLRGPFDQVTAKAVEKYSKTNFEKLNKNK
jgi:hypothetical protein